MDIEITKDSDYLICSNGMNKIQASSMGGSEEIQKELFPNWSVEDVDATCRELHRAELLHCFFADDIVSEAVLSDKAIIYMENRFKNNVDTIMDYISKIKSMIPFI